MTALTEEKCVKCKLCRPDAADKVVTWATQLSDLAKGGAVDWSDTWTDEDLQDVRTYSLANFEEREPE